MEKDREEKKEEYYKIERRGPIPEKLEIGEKWDFQKKKKENAYHHTTYLDQATTATCERKAKDGEETGTA